MCRLLFQSVETIEDPNDNSYNPDHESIHDSDLGNWSQFITSSEKSDLSTEKKYVVTEGQLMQLLKRIPCPDCASPPDKILTASVGTCFKAKTTCSCGSPILDWKSQPFIGRMASFNLLIAAAIMFSGGTFQAFDKCASYAGLQFINRYTFYNVQRNLLIPAINTVYDKVISEAREECKKDGNVTGDGRYDSQGKKAKYCTYSVQSPRTKKILATSTVQTKCGKGSSPLELETFINCLAQLNSAGVKVDKISTDRNKQLAKWLRENKPNIKHRYDPWHFAKNIKGKLRPIALKKDCKHLQEWIKPIANHVFYLASNSDSDPQKIVSMWKSLLYHCSNRHSFKSLKHYQKCDHKPYTSAQSRKKKWIKTRTEAYEELEKIVNDAKTLTDIPKLAGADHTGNIEVFNSVLLSYAPKRIEFDHHVMDARVKLAAIDFNENINRPNAVIKKPNKLSGKLGEQKYKFQLAKQSNEWVAKEVKVPKTNRFIETLLKEVISLKTSGKVVKAKYRNELNTPKNIAATQRPDKEVILAKKAAQKRFKNQ